MADPVGALSIAFDATPMAADPAWTRIDTLAGCRVQEYTIDRGRPTEFDKTDTGTAVVRLDRPGRAVRPDQRRRAPTTARSCRASRPRSACRTRCRDEWFTLFRGFVESWHYRLDQTRQYMELELQLVDGFAILARAILEVGCGRCAAAVHRVRRRASEALNELAAGNVLYGETTGTVKDRIDGILEDVGWPDDAPRHVLRQRPGRPESLRARHQRAGRDLGCRRRRVPRCRELLDEQGRACSRSGAGRPGSGPEVAAYNINERTVGDPSGWELDERRGAVVGAGMVERAGQPLQRLQRDTAVGRARGGADRSGS